MERESWDLDACHDIYIYIFFDACHDIEAEHSMVGFFSKMAEVLFNLKIGGKLILKVWQNYCFG